MYRCTHFFHTESYSLKLFYPSFTSQKFKEYLKSMEIFLLTRFIIFSDLQEFVHHNKAFIADEEYKKVDTFTKRFETAFVGLKDNFKNRLYEIRSGLVSFSTLDNVQEEFESQKYSTKDVKHFINEHIDLREKIDHFKKFTEKGAEIIKDKVDLSSAKKTRGIKLYILFISYKNDRYDPLYDETTDHFLRLCDKKEKEKFFVVDKEVFHGFHEAEPNVPDGVRICAFFNGKYTSSDVLTDQSETFCSIKNMEDAWDIPKNMYSIKVPIKFPCPKAQEKDGCEEDEHEWKCHKCSEIMKYGFDQKLYCKCGVQSIYHFGYKCISDMHGDDYVKFKQDKLDHLMSKLQLPKTG